MKNFIAICFEQLLAHPKKTLLIISVLLLVLMSGLKELRPNYHMRYWLKKGDPLIELLNYFERHFGNDETIVIAIHSEQGILSRENIHYIERLRKKIEQLDDIRFAHSLTNFSIPYYSEQERDVRIRPLVDFNKILDPSIIEKDIFSNSILPNFFISQDKTTALIFGVLKRTILWEGEIEQEVDYLQLTGHLKALLEENRRKGINIHLSGTAILQNDFHEIAEKDALSLMPVIFLFIIITLSYLFRSWGGICYPLIILTLTNMATYSLGGLLGFQIENMFSVVPLIIMTICLADTIHFFTTYFKDYGEGASKREALRSAYQVNFIPTLLTSITTSIGFLSLSFSDLVPVRNLGILSAFGTMMAWFLTFSILPILLNFGQDRGLKKQHKLHLLDFSLMTPFLNRQKGIIIMGFLLTSLSALIYGSANDINTNPLTFFKKDWPARRAADFIINKVGAVSGPEIIVHSGYNQGILNPQFLKKVDQFSRWLDEQSYINKSISLINMAKEIRQIDNKGDASFFAIPDTEREVRNLILEYRDKLTNTFNFNNRATVDMEAIRITLLWSLMDTKSSLFHIAEIEKKAKDLGLHIDITGKSALYLKMNDYVVRTFFISMLMAICLIFLLMVYVFKSFKLGLFSMLPNVVPISFIIGLMMTLNINFDMGTALVASVCLGIAIDDTIHFLFHYKRYRQKGMSAEEAIQKVLAGTGKALVLTTGMLAISFSFFAFGEFIPNVNFGILCSLTLLFALFTDLILLPSILLWTDRAKPKMPQRG